MGQGRLSDHNLGTVVHRRTVQHQKVTSHASLGGERGATAMSSIGSQIFLQHLIPRMTQSAMYRNQISVSLRQILRKHSQRTGISAPRFWFAKLSLRGDATELIAYRDIRQA